MDSGKILRDSGGALGEDLRYLAIEGMDKELLKRLKGVANTASTDDLGLSPLMYAVRTGVLVVLLYILWLSEAYARQVWNGHVECVKLLVANPHGVDKEGNRCNALEMQSNLGYTALHLAALDCPSWAVKEISFLLLLVFEDYEAKCVDGRTAVEIARDENNTVFIDQYNKFTGQESDDVHKERVTYTKQSLGAKYTFRMPEIPKRVKTKFALPERSAPESLRAADVSELSTAKPLRYSRRIPPATLIPEQELLPLVEHGDVDMTGAKSLKCMKFAIAQSEKNAERRIGLVKNFDTRCEALDVTKYVS